VPKRRPPREVWQALRRIAWERDGRQCVRCHDPLSLEACHTDHIRSGKRGTNALSNLRTLCRKCHVLREDGRHRGMIASALKDGIIDANWREQLWSD